ncbi:unnamed protein product [Adineta ricciae]|uniref:Serpin domain-containing protein n=1 Tax=Adineta ricciae TaxID=249248 RepID=A0A816FRP3_ADIRI|nr:unnamed protein product [Adineta ricciae]
MVDFPYKRANKDIQFVFRITLPNGGVLLSEIQQKFTSQPTLLEDIFNQQKTTTQEILLYIPKFKMETQFELKTDLEQLAIHDAFDTSKANFSGIVSQQNNTEAAAAATNVIMTLSCAKVQQPPHIVFRAERPFLFYIRERRQFRASTS